MRFEDRCAVAERAASSRLLAPSLVVLHHCAQAPQLHSQHDSTEEGPRRPMDTCWVRREAALGWDVKRRCCSRDDEPHTAVRWAGRITACVRSAEPLVCQPWLSRERQASALGRQRRCMV